MQAFRWLGGQPVADNPRIYSQGIIRSGIKTYVAILVLAATLLVLSVFLDDYYRAVIIVTVLWAYWATAWNILGGFCGQLSVGHTVFIGLGAYGAAVLFAHASLSPWIAVPCTGIGGAVLGYAIGAVLFRARLRASFFALATFAIGQIGLYVVLNTQALGAGEGFLIPRGQQGYADLQFVSRMPYLALALGLLAIGVAVAQGIRRSRFGHRLIAIREDEDAAAALGINVRQEKCAAFAISGGLTAIGAVLYAQYVLYVDPQSVLGEAPAIQIVLFTIFGGSGTVWGPVLGASILYPLAGYFRNQFSGEISGLDLIFLGCVLIVFVPLLPDGVLGLLAKAFTQARLFLHPLRSRLRARGEVGVDP